MGSWRWDNNTDTFTFSPNWFRIHGLTPSYRREDLRRLVHPEHIEAVTEAFHGVSREGKDFRNNFV